ncbi:hypothetical protein [Cellulomonas sp.]|uniref:hypothetical protein n=1 Tax=Cellulomonas sp. TaxID=40001 RepID=UPI003BA896E9
MSGDTSDRRRARSLVVPVTFVAMMAAGIVLALDFVVEWPSAVVVTAAAVALLGLAVLVVVGVRRERRSGAGLFRSLGRAVRGAVRAAFDLF